MLVLTRRIGENVIIGDNIIIRVLDIAGQVKLGIEAPKDITVHREEIYEKIQTALSRRFTELCQPNQSSIFNLPSK